MHNTNAGQNGFGLVKFGLVESGLVWSSLIWFLPSISSGHLTRPKLVVLGLSVLCAACIATQSGVWCCVSPSLLLFEERGRRYEISGVLPPVVRRAPPLYHPTTITLLSIVQYLARGIISTFFIRIL